MKKPWVSEHTTKLAEERIEAKSKGDRDNWKMLDKELVKSARHDKNQFLEKKKKGKRALRKSFR